MEEEQMEVVEVWTGMEEERKKRENGEKGKNKGRMTG